MKKRFSVASHTGVAVAEGLLVLLIIAAVALVSLYVVHARRNVSGVVSSTSSRAKAAAAPGTPASIDDATAADAASDAAADGSTDTQVRQNAGLSDTAAANLGEAYNAANL